MNKKLKKLITLSSVLVPIASAVILVSCNSNSSNKESKSQEAKKILNSYLEKSDYKLGAKNSKNFNEKIINSTKATMKLFPFLKKDANSNFFKSLKQEWEKYLPVTDDETIAKQNYIKFLNLYAIAKNMNTKTKKDFIDEKSKMFRDDYWNINDSKYLKNKDYLNKYGTVFPSHSDSPYMIFQYARFLVKINDNSSWTVSQKKNELIKWIFQWNEWGNRRNFTVPGATGSGYSSFESERRQVDSIKDLLIAYAISPNLSKLTKIQKNDVFNSNKTYKTFHNKELEKFIIKYLNYFTTKVYYAGIPEYDNWWPYEIALTRSLTNWMKILVNSPLSKNIKKWLSPVFYFTPDPLYQHASKGAIYNSVPAVKTLNTGANLMDYIYTSTLVDLISGDLDRAKKDIKKAYTFLFKNYTNANEDGFKSDGGFIQHNNIPHNAHYGNVVFKVLGDIQKLVAGSSLDIFKNIPGMQNVFKLYVQSFIPYFFKGSIDEHTVGRELPKTHDEALNTGTESLESISYLLQYSKNKKYTNIIKNFIAEQVQTSPAFKNKTPEDIGKMGIDPIAKSYNYVPTKKLIDDYDGLKQIFSADMVLWNHYDKNNNQDWVFSTRFHDRRVGFYESQLGMNLQGMYMGDGMQLVKTSKNSQAFTGYYWIGVDAYHLPGTVSYIPEQILDPNLDSNGQPIGGNTKKLENEWVHNKSSIWATKINRLKNDATGIGFTGGVKMNNYSNTMNYSNSYDGKISQRRSLITLGNRVLVLGQIENPSSNVILNIDNRMTENNSLAKYTRGKISNGAEPWIYEDPSTGEKIGYITYGFTPSKDDIVYDGITKIRPWILADAKNFDINNKHNKIPKTPYKRTFHRLTHKLSKNNTFSYTTIPNVKNINEVENIIKNEKLKIVRNDQYAQIVQYTNKENKEFLFVNIFENNNFSTTIDWFDKTNPVRLSATRPTSFIFKKDDDGYFSVVAQDAIHDGKPTRVSLGKKIKNISTGMSGIFLPEDNPQYINKREWDYQSYEIVEDNDVNSIKWFNKYSKSIVTLAKESLGEIDEYFYRDDQIDLIPDPRFELQKEHSFKLKFS